MARRPRGGRRRPRRPRHPPPARRHRLTSHLAAPAPLAARARTTWCARGYGPHLPYHVVRGGEVGAGGGGGPARGGVPGR
ncbi:hypothetical protein FTX61_17050 [Nitriliruptoraceae bacterium ZYF776]|nr:hypothetical protein [Profundirhabdus halotolerans]